jgi:hypothetical protein
MSSNCKGKKTGIARKPKMNAITMEDNTLNHIYYPSVTREGQEITKMMMNILGGQG